MSSRFAHLATRQYHSKSFIAHPYQTWALFAGLLILVTNAHAETNPSEKASQKSEITEDIVEMNIDGTKVAQLFEKFSGNKVIITPEAAAATFSIVHKASKIDPITYSEAKELIRRSVVLEDFSFIQEPSDPKIFVLKPFKLRTGGCCTVHVYNSPTSLPKNNEVITYVMELKCIDPKDALNRLQKVMEKRHDQASISCVPNSAAIVITDTVSNVKSYIDLQNEFDQPADVPVSTDQQ